MKIKYYSYDPNSGIGEHEIDSESPDIYEFNEKTITLCLRDNYGPYIDTFKRNRAKLEKEVYEDLIHQKAKIEIQLQKHFAK